MDVLTNAGSLIVVLGIIIFCHEFGHFITAKAFGMRVFVFSFGFGQRLMGFKWGDTDCRLSLIPLGGYVKLEGEPEDLISENTQALGDGKDFLSRPRWQRFLVYVAGPAMNGVLTVTAFTCVFMAGSLMDATQWDRPLVGAIEVGSPAEQAGIKPGDELVAIDDKPLETWEDALYSIALRPDADVKLRLRRSGAELDLTVHSTTSKAKDREQLGHIGVAPLVRIGRVCGAVTPCQNMVPGNPAETAGLRKDDGVLRIGEKAVASFDQIPAILAEVGAKPVVFQVLREGQVVEIPVTPKDGRVGIERRTVLRKFGFGAAFGESLRFTWSQIKLTFEVIGRLLTARLSPKTMVGPLGIAKASGEAAKEGAASLFYLVAMVSLQVGILNLLPVAPLDGGHLAILLGEGVMRRDFSINVKEWILRAGVAMVLLLIVVAFYSDLSRTGWFGKFLP